MEAHPYSGRLMRFPTDNESPTPVSLRGKM